MELEDIINFFGISTKKMKDNGQIIFIYNIINDMKKESNNTNYNNFKKFKKAFLQNNYQKKKFTIANSEEDEMKNNKLLSNNIKTFKNPKFNLDEFTYLYNYNLNNNKEFEVKNKKEKIILNNLENKKYNIFF